MEDSTPKPEPWHRQLTLRFGELLSVGNVAVYAIVVLLLLLVYVGFSEVNPKEPLDTETIWLSEGDQLLVIFPTLLRITSDESESEIVLSLIPNLKAVGNRSYTVTLGNSDRVLLLDMDGEGYIFRRTLSPSESVAALRVRPSIQIHKLPATILFQLHVESADDDEKIDPVDRPLPIPVEKPSFFYRLSVWIVGKAEALALILTLLALVWEYREYARHIFERKSQDHKEFIESIKQWKPTDIEDYDQGLGRIIQKDRQLSQENHYQIETWRKEFLNVCDTVFKQNDRWAMLIRLLGDGISEHPSKHLSTSHRILVNLVLFHTRICASEAHDQHFSALKIALFEQVEDAQLQNIFSELLEFWRKYVYDSAALIALAVARISIDNANYLRQPVIDILLWHCREDTEFRPLLRHARLRTLLTHSKELADLATYDYRWPAVEVIRPPSHLSKRLTDWLPLAELRIHPFAEAVDYRRDQLLGETWVPPISWDKLEKPGNLLAHFEAPGDAELCVHYLLRRLYQKEFFGRLPTFPIQLSFGAAIGQGEIADAILHSHTTTWFDFLSTNREAFEEMPETDQQMLAELFIWSAGSFPALRSWMLSRTKRMYAADEAYFIPVLRRIQNIVSRTQSFGSPGLSKRLSWLPMRPPGYTQSYLVGTVHPDYTDLQYTNLLHLIPHLKEHHIYLKLLGYRTSMPASDSRESVAAIRRESMSWPAVSLGQILDARVLNASGNRFPFAALLEPQMHDPNGRLARAAGGSLTRLLTLGHRLIERHIQQTEITKYISEETFEAILRE